MIEATLLGKYRLPIHISLSSEEDRAKGKRSYAHYLSEHQPLVAAKVAATKWLLDNCGLDADGSYTSVEYLAGVGIQTCLIMNTFNIREQALRELDATCVQQLSSVAWGVPTEVRRQDVLDGLKNPTPADLVFLDFPSSSVLTLKKKWLGFENVFSNTPKLVVWTDTSVTYPLTIHGARYAEIMRHNEPIKTESEYLKAVSSWLNREHGYSIAAAAFRARNAVYIAARPGTHEMKTARFMPADHAGDFTLN